MPAEALDPPEPRPPYSTYLLLHNVLRILAADDCEIVITTENVGPAVKAARDLLRALGHRARAAATSLGLSSG